MPIENMVVIDIGFHSDDLLLQGTLHLPAVPRPPLVIGCHGLHSNKDSPKQIALAEACSRLGLAYFRFDHRGCGRSQGEFEKVTSLPARCRDLRSALNTIRNRAETGDLIGLFGSSMGGTVCLSIAGSSEVAAVVTFAAPVRSRTHNQILKQPGDSNAGGIHFDARKSDFDISEKLSRVSNILIIHGEADETVPLSHAKEIHRLAREPKKLIVQPNGDHRMSNTRHQSDFIRKTSEWFKSGLCHH